MEIHPPSSVIHLVFQLMTLASSLSMTVMQGIFHVFLGTDFVEVNFSRLRTIEKAAEAF